MPKTSKGIDKYEIEIEIENLRDEIKVQQGRMEKSSGSHIKDIQKYIIVKQKEINVLQKRVADLEAHEEAAKAAANISKPYVQASTYLTLAIAVFTFFSVFITATGIWLSKLNWDYNASWIYTGFGFLAIGVLGSFIILRLLYANLDSVFKKDE
jgi:hypothetical protein